MADKTCLNSLHNASAAMGEIDGCEVPLYFSGAESELLAAREKCCVFDLSHLGRIRLRGYGSPELLSKFTDADVHRQEDDTAMNVTLCGVECTLVRLSDFWVVVTPHSAEATMMETFKSADCDDVKMDSQTNKVVQFAVVGPAGREILDKVLPVKVGGLDEGQAKFGSLLLANYIAYRRDVAGLWTLHVMLPNMFATKAWKFITEKAGDNAITPAGVETWNKLAE